MKHRYKPSAFHACALALLAALAMSTEPALGAMSIQKGKKTTIRKGISTPESEMRTKSSKSKSKSKSLSDMKYIEVFESGYDDRAKEALMPRPGQLRN